MSEIPKMCVTCQNYRPYHCELTDNYIGYLHSDVITKCKSYRLSEDYKKGGKFYESRFEVEE